VSNGTNEIRIAVVMEAFLDQSLEDTLDWLTDAAPEVTDLEIGAGGYAPHPHCDTDTMLADADARKKWLSSINDKGFNVAAFNTWGNPLHGDKEIAQGHDDALRNGIRLATEIGCNRIVAMAGCPPATLADTSPHFAGGGWLPYLENVYEQQWVDRIESYWSEVNEFAQSVNPDLMICLELHPGTVAYNVTTFERVSSLGPSINANLDPSHFMWMQMDALKVASRIYDRVGHMHGKDVTFHEESLALNGVMDSRWPQPAAEMPWTFSVPGRGHDLAWWTELLTRTRGSRATVISIEHEDPFVSPQVGVPEAAKLLRQAIDASTLVSAS
jgi:sugar phosphate isomerase/epimerase